MPPGDQLPNPSILGEAVAFVTGSLNGLPTRTGFVTFNDGVASNAATINLGLTTAPYVLLREVCHRKDVPPDLSREK